MLIAVIGAAVRKIQQGLIGLLAKGDALFFSEDGDAENSKALILDHGQAVPRVADKGPSLGDNRLMRGGWCADFGLGSPYGNTSANVGSVGTSDLEIEWTGEVVNVASQSIVTLAGSAADVRLMLSGANVVFETYNGGLQSYSIAHGVTYGDFATVRASLSGGTVEIFVNGSSVGSGSVASDCGTQTSTEIGHRDTSDLFGGKFAACKITIGGTVVGWWQTGAEESGTTCYSLIDGRPNISWVNRPTGFQVQDANVTSNICDDLGYRDAGSGVIEPAAYQTDGTTPLGTTAAGNALDYEGRAPRHMPISRTVLELGATSYVLLPAMSPTSGATFACYVRTTATSGDLLSDGVSNQSFSWSSGGSGSINASSVEIDGVAFSGNDGALYTALADDAWHYVTWAHDVSGWSARRISSGFVGYIADFVIDDGGTLAHYPLQEADGIICTDISGNGNHGTLTNATGTQWETQSDMVPDRGWTEGVVRQMEFDGTNNLQWEISGADQLTGLDDFTVQIDGYSREMNTSALRTFYAAYGGPSGASQMIMAANNNNTFGVYLDNVVKNTGVDTLPAAGDLLIQRLGTSTYCYHRANSGDSWSLFGTLTHAAGTTIKAGPGTYMTVGGYSAGSGRLNGAVGRVRQWNGTQTQGSTPSGDPDLDANPSVDVSGVGLSTPNETWTATTGQTARTRIGQASVVAARAASSGETPGDDAYSRDALNSISSKIALPTATAVHEFDPDLSSAYATSASDATPATLKEPASPTNDSDQILRANAYDGEIVMLSESDAGKASQITGA